MLLVNYVWPFEITNKRNMQSQRLLQPSNCMEHLQKMRCKLHQVELNSMNSSGRVFVWAYMEEGGGSDQCVKPPDWHLRHPPPLPTNFISPIPHKTPIDIIFFFTLHPQIGFFLFVLRMPSLSSTRIFAILVVIFKEYVNIIEYQIIFLLEMLLPNTHINCAYRNTHIRETQTTYNIHKCIISTIIQSHASVNNLYKNVNFKDQLRILYVNYISIALSKWRNHYKQT